jgi:hypothetical protein
MAAKYHIFQMTPDPFRREPRNVGVVVELHGRTAARFVAENEKGEIDGRKLRSIPHGNVYKQWVTHWRRQLRAGGLDALLAPPKRAISQFQIVSGGEVDGTGKDSVSDVADYLYSMIVSEGGFREAIGESPQQEVNASLIQELERAFSTSQIMEGMHEQVSAFARHPVQRDVQVRGASRAPYRPPFYQKNGLTYVIETADLETRFRARIREHAGHAAYMFADLRREYQDDLRPISVVHGSGDTLQDEAAEFTLTVLRNESQVVRWWVEDERERFLAERRAVALS